ncbi:sensor histidine kinase [Paenibacillus sp. y28]|uniref:sensor histidine kinase n=1 Tax=Paenibacillus sp. y28 TaxID=3129110 RepID=UPI00301A5156
MLKRPAFRFSRFSLQRSKLSTLMVSCFIFFNLLFLSAVLWIAYQAFSDVTFTEISKARLALLNESTKRGFDFIPNVTGMSYSLVSSKELIERLERSGADSKLDLIIKRREVSQLLQRTLVVNKGVSAIELYTDVFRDVSGSAGDGIYPISGITETGWFMTLKQADSVWVSLPDEETGASLIGYAQRIFNQQGGTVGYVLIRLTRADIIQRFADVPLVLEGQVLLLDTAGKIVMQVDDPGFEGRESAADSEWLTALTYVQEDGYEIKWKNNASHLVIYSKPSTIQWRLVQIVPVSVLLAGTRQAGWYVFGIGVLGLVLSAAFAYFFVSRIIRPLRILIQGMKRLERGHFDTQVKLSFTEEYAQLSHGFNHMASRLTDLMDAVKRESKAKREAETGLLEAQIKPHFLYNTLDMIHWRALDYEAEDISRMILQLSRLLRIGLSGGRMFIRVRDELEHARCYVDIQRERLSFGIDYKERMDPRIRGFFIPKVILQPLIENAVIHGNPQGKLNILTVKLELSVLEPPGEPPRLEISVTDNGAGLPDGWELGSAKGIGLHNVHKRIQLYCGMTYGLRAARNGNSGTKVTMTLPVIETEEELNQWLDGDSQ